MSEVLNVKTRPLQGKKNNRRLRAAGEIPAVLYGHGEEAVSLSVSKTQLSSAMRHGARLVELQGGVATSALIKDLQYDSFYTDVLHVDFTRVSATEQITVKVSVVLKGESIGAKSGGIVEIVEHEISIRCPAGAIPDHIIVNITDLGVGKSIHAGEIPLPPGVTLAEDPHHLVVHCVVARAEEEGVPGAATGAEPEIIAKGKKDEEGGEGEDK